MLLTEKVDTNKTARAADARNDFDDSRNRPALAHGKLEKPEQQVILVG